MTDAVRAPTPTDSQWDAVRAYDRHTLVAAGAGTGKTSTVVSRILYLLGVEIRGATCPAPLELRDIGAITYTNAAAADLKRKLRDALSAAGRRDLSYEVDGARIGTIHGFCGDVLREFALRAGRAPEPRVLEDGEAAALIGEAVHQTVVGAIERGMAGGLDALIGAWPVTEIESWLARLAGDSARLDRIAAHRAAVGTLGALEDVVLGLALRARAAVERRLREADVVDFDRMIVWTRDLLRQDALVRRVLRRRLRVLIVDEFQDVDPTQKEIAYLLGDPASRRDDTTRLMLVGDPKQSIYRFRRADVTVWREVERDFTDGGLGAVVTLAENFRSVAPVLAFVDATVGTILDRPIDGDRLRDFEAPFHPVVATREAAPGEPAVELTVVVPDEDAKPIADAVRAAEASAIAARARELHDGGVAWSEMALLLPTWSSLDRYETALRRAGVPTYALRGEGFYGRREVLDMVLALEVMRDPRDDRALVGWLRSPFVGLRDETLLSLAWQADQPYWDWLPHVEVAPSERALLDRAVALLAEHVALRDRVPADALLGSLLERSGYLAHLYALGPDADQAAANVRKFLRIARQVPGQSVGDLLRAAAEQRDRGDREGDARLYSPSEDVFTITSIHSAKGLEWRVVFWGDTIAVPQRAAGNILIGRDRLAIKDPELEAESQPLHWQRLLQDEDAEQLAERKRLWYVAATRAKDRLIVSGLCPAKKETRSAGAALVAALGNPDIASGDRLPFAGRAGREYHCAVRRVPLPTADASAPSPDHETDVPPPFVPRPIPELLPALASPTGRTRHSASELMAHARCQRRHWLRYVVGLPEPGSTAHLAQPASAPIRGQIVHDVLERLDDPADYGVELDAAIGRWDPGALPPEGVSGAAAAAYTAELRAEIDAVARHPDYRALADLPTARRELPFLHIVNEDCAIEGRLDLVACDDGELVGLDVKVAAGGPDRAKRLAESYALQRSVYVNALAAISGLPVGRFTFHFSGAGIQVSTPGDAVAADGEVDRILASMEAGHPALTADPAQCAACGYRTAGWCQGASPAT